MFFQLNKFYSFVSAIRPEEHITNKKVLEMLQKYGPYKFDENRGQY
jgi:hypothetical protein